MKHGSLFSGIGGFDLASEWMGWENVFHCEWNPFGQKVLHHYWPKAIQYHDITKTDFTIHRGQIDIITGGFPCQPYSMAGKRKGKEDERHLWPEMLRAIREIQPTWVVGENVLGLVNWDGGLVFHEVQAELEAQGYEVQPYVLPAASVNAPHRRDRVWFVAYSDHKGRGSGFGQVQSKDGEVSEWDNNAKPSDTGIQSTASDSNCNTKRPSKESAGTKEERNQRFVQQREWGDAPKLDNRLYEFSQYATDSELKGSQGQRGKWKGCSEHRSDEGVFVGSENKFNATDSNGIGLRGQGDRIGESRFFDKESKIGNWNNFPTVSAICSRNDGISDRLDSITFSKWRNESIKAGGNAIVPQVVHQIFKAIQQYNDLDK